MAFTKTQYKPGDELTAEKMNDIQDELLSHRGKLDELEIEKITYNIQNYEDFKDALIEQASTMTPGSERMLYIIDENRSVALNGGYCVVKLYHHQSSFGVTSNFVAVDIFDADDRYTMCVSKAKNQEVWICTEKVRVTTSADGHTLGMVREFDSGELDSNDVSDTAVHYYGNNSKFYTVTISDGLSLYATTIDYRALNQSGNTFFAIPTYDIGAKTVDSATVRVYITTESNGTKSVHFVLDNASHQNFKIAKICGYY